MIKTCSIELTSKGFCDVQDITDKTANKIMESGIKNGIAALFVPGATGGLTTIEYEGGAVKDFKTLWEKLIPQDAFYEHNARWGDGNGFSHLRASLLGPSLTVPIVNSSLTLGTWQQIIFVDFDNRNRNRSLILQIIGE